MATAKTVRVQIICEKGMSFVPVPFDPKSVFGKVRAPVKVTLNGYTYRSTIFSMNGHVGVPLRESNADAAGLSGGETLDVTFTLDEEKRTVTPPAALVKALKAHPPAWDRWGSLSFTHQREWVEAILEARKPETRARRIENAVQAVAQRPARAAKKTPTSK